MIPINCCFCSSSSVVVNRFENPTIAFNGVRISWLMLARNADFRRSDSFAFSLAEIRACSCFLRSVINSNEPIRAMGCPVLSHWDTAALISSQSMCSFPAFWETMRNSALVYCNFPFKKSWCICLTRVTSSGCILWKYSLSSMICIEWVEPSCLVKFMWLSTRCTSQAILWFFKSQRHGIIRATLNVISNFLADSLKAFSALLRLVTSSPKISITFSSADWQMMNS